MGIKHERLSSYNPSSNGLSEAGMRVVKVTLKKAGVVKGAELDRLMFDLNSMLCGDGSGAPIELLLGRNFNTFLPNSGNKFLSVKRDFKISRLEDRGVECEGGGGRGA